MSDERLDAERLRRVLPQGARLLSQIALAELLGPPPSVRRYYALCEQAGVKGKWTGGRRLPDDTD